jgi:hypothetical protein
MPSTPPARTTTLVTLLALTSEENIEDGWMIWNMAGSAELRTLTFYLYIRLFAR